MARTWLFLPALLLLVAPALADDWTPALTTRRVDDGIKLEWTTPEGPRGQTIDHVEVWRHVPIAQGGPGTWELYAVRNGVAPYYVDEAGAGDTFYFVRLVFPDGETSPPSNPSSVDYPHCSWIMVTIPPVVTTHCLFPPPFISEGKV